MSTAQTTVTVYTRDKAVMRRLDALSRQFPDTYRLIGETDIDKTYSMPKSCVTYRKPRRLTDEQREQARRRIEKVNRIINNETNSKVL